MKMKRFLSLVISTAMTLSAFSGFAMTSASAEEGDTSDAESTVISWFPKAGDGTPIEGVPDDGSADCATIAAGAEFMNGALVSMNSGKYKTLLDIATKFTDLSGNAVTAPEGLIGRVTPDKGSNDPDRAFKFTAPADGVLDVYVKVSNNKSFYIMPVSEYETLDKAVNEPWTNTTGSSQYKKISGPVTNGTEYYLYSKGAGIDMFGVVFNEGAEYVPPVVESTEPDKPKPVDPDSKAWSVSAGDIGRKAGDLLMGGLTLVSDNTGTEKYVTAADNGKIETTEDGKIATGSALKFVAPSDGKLEVTMIDCGGTNTDGSVKSVTPVIYGVTEKENLFEYTTTVAKEKVELSADVKEGNSYYITATGTKGRFSAAKFTPDGTTPDTPETPDTPDTPSAESITYKDGVVTVKADDTSVTSGELIIASYNDGVLSSVKTENLTFTDGIATVSDLTLEKGTKLMAWDSLAGMKPLCKAGVVGDAVVTTPTDEPEDSDTVVFRADDTRIASMTTTEEDNGKGGTNTVISPAQEMGVWTVQPGWQVKNASNIKYTHTDGTEYTFTKALYAGSGSTTSRAVSFVPKSSCKVTAVFDGTGAADRVMNIAQNGKVIASAKSVAGEVSAFSAEITDTSAPVYVYGGGSNKNLYAVIVEYMEPETQADYVKVWDFQQVNYGKAEGVAEGLVCNENIADQKNDGTNGKGFLTGSNGGEVKVPVEADKLDENKVAVVKVTYNWDASFDFEGVKTYEQSQGGDNVAEYIYDASCVNDGFVTINTKGTTYIKKIERTTLFKAPVTGTITSNSAKDLTGKNIVFTDKASGNTVKALYGETYSAELINGRDYAVSVEGMTDVCATLETMNFTANVKKTEFNIELMDIAESEVTGDVVGLDNPAGITLTFTNASDEAKTVNAVITNAETPDTKNLNPVTGTLSATLMPNNTYNVTASGLPDGYSLSPLSQTYFMEAGDTKPFKNILIVKDTPVVDYTTLTDGTINVGPNGDYKTVNEALAVVKQMTNRGNNRVTLNLEAGVTFTEQVIVDVNNVTFTSDPDNKATIQWYYGVGYLYYSAKNGYYDRDLAVAKTSKNSATKWGCTVYIKGAGFLAENINFDATLNQKVIDAEIADGVEPAEPGSPQYSDGRGYCPDRAADGFDPKAKDSTERAAAMAVDGNNAEFYNCKFQSSQDTLYTGSNAAYFKNCDIYGMTDYIFGGNSVLFEQCNLVWEGYSTEDKNGPIGGYITAVKTSSNTDNGYVFKNCTVAKNSDPVMKSSAGTWGRNWGGTNCAVYFINTTIADGASKPVGWTKMGGDLSGSKLFVKGVYAVSDTEKATDLTVNTGDLDSKGNTANDNPNGAMSGEAPADMTVLNNWVPKHYEGERPPVTDYVTTWYFGHSNGAPDYNAEGSASQPILVSGENNAETTQTMTVNASSGKFNNMNGDGTARADEWCQVNTGTKFTFPVVEGSVITFGAYDDYFKLTVGETEFIRSGSYTVPAGVTSVSATVTNGGYMSFIKTITPVANGKPSDPEPETMTGTVTINGAVKYGETLTASVEGSNVTDTSSYTYKWLSADTEDGTYAEIANAVSASYTAAAADVGKFLKCEVGTTASGFKGTVSAKTSTAVAKADMTGAVSVSGTVKEGETVTAAVTTNAGTDYTIQWQASTGANGAYENIDGAVSASYTIADGLAGKTLKCVITSTSASVAGTIASDPTSAVASKEVELPAITGTVTVSGSVSAGKTLTAEVSGLNSGAAAQYQWQANTGADGAYENIANATSAEYTIDASLVGKTLKCVVTTGSTTGSIESAVTSAVQEAVITASGTITITGMYNNNGNKRDQYKMKAEDLVLKFTPAAGEAVTAAVKGVQGGTDDNALSYTATLKPGTVYTVSLEDTAGNAYNITAGASVTTDATSDAANNITASKSYTYSVPVEFDANSYAQLSDGTTYTITFNSRNGYTPESLTFTKADIDAETRLVTAEGHGFKPVDTNGDGNNYFIAHFDKTSVHANASAADGYEQALSTDTSVNPTVGFGKISVTLPNAPTGVTISGTVTALETLQAVVEPADAGVSYQWYTAEAADSAEDTWTAIDGATNASLQLTNALKDKFIAVKVTGTGLAGTASAITQTAVTASDITSYTYNFKIDQTASTAPSYNTNTNLLANSEEGVNNVDKAISMVLAAKDGAASCAATGVKISGNTTYPKWRIATRGTSTFQNLNAKVDTSTEGFTWETYSNAAANPVIVVTPKVSGTFTIVIGHRTNVNSTFYIWDNESEAMEKKSGQNEVQTITFNMQKNHTYVMGHTGTGDGAVYEASFTTLENLPE